MHLTAEVVHCAVTLPGLANESARPVGWWAGRHTHVQAAAAWEVDVWPAAGTGPRDQLISLAWWRFLLPPPPPQRYFTGAVAEGVSG